MTKKGIFVSMLVSALPVWGSLDQLPVRFEPNRGQAPPDVRFLARGKGFTLALTSRGAAFQAGEKVLRFQLDGANPAASVTGEQPYSGRSNYLLGADASQWVRDVPHYGRVRLSQVYPGIDLLYYGNPNQLEYDFVVRPGADPNRIAFTLEGAGSVRTDRGELVFSTPDGEVRQKAPVVYQEFDGRRRSVQARYRVAQNGLIRFALGAYRADKELVIDPVLLFATYYGGRIREEAKSIGLDAEGNLYVAGLASSSDFPVAPGALQSRLAGSTDLFVVKLNKNGTQVAYSTFIGGSATEMDAAMAVSPTGEVFLGGTTTSTNFPTTGAAYRNQAIGGTDGFALKLNTTGSNLIFSTFIGSKGTDGLHGIAIDGNGNVYVTGETDATDFPVTEETYQLERKGTSDCFITKLEATGRQIVYSTYLGGDSDSFTVAFESCRAIAVDRHGNAHVGGITTLRDFPTVNPAFQNLPVGLGEAFVTKINNTGKSLLFSTFLGGEGNDQVNALTLDGVGNLYAAGSTTSARFPTTPQVFQRAGFGGTTEFNEGWVAKIDGNGGLVYSTFLGGSGDETVNGIVADAGGHAYVIGTTNSLDFPVTFDAIQASRGQGSPERDDAFITHFDPLGQKLLWSSYLGGTRNEIGSAITRDAMGELFVAGYTQSPSFPITPGALQKSTGFGTSTAFIARIGEVLRAPSQLFIISGNNQTANQDTVLPLPLVVELRDQFNNPQRNLTIQFGGTNVILSQPAVNTDQNGRAEIHVRLGNRPGAASVEAKFGNVPPVTFNFTVVRVGPPLPAISTNGVVSGGLSQPPVRQVSSNSIAVVSGEFFAPPGTDRAVGADDLVDGKLPTNFLGTCVAVNGIGARITGVAASRVTFQVPEGLPFGPARVVVITNCGQPGELRSDAATVEVVSASPEFYYSGRDVTGRSFVLAVDGSSGAVIDPSNPARPNQIIIVFGTGFGPTNPAVGSGEIPAGPAPTVETPIVTLDGEPLAPDNVLYTGLTSGQPGIYQLRFAVPGNARNGNLRIGIRFGTQASPANTVLPITGGRDIQPRVIVSPSRFDFGQVITGQARELPFTVANAGSAPLTISEFRVGLPVFAITPAAELRLNPGEQRLLVVKFSPTVAGPASTTLTIISDDESNPRFEVPLAGAGTGVPPVPNPKPEISSLSPSGVDEGGGGFNLIVNGSGFVSSSVVEWNGQPRSTFFNHPGQLIVFITSIDTAFSGTARITVLNPAPGGGRSSEAIFAIRAVAASTASVLVNQFDLRGCPEIASYVSVLTAGGQPVGGLPGNSISCTEDGQPVDCRSTAGPDVEMSVLLILGLNGLSTDDDVSFLKTAARDFVNSLRGTERISVVHLETDARPLLPFTTDHDAVRDMINRLRPVGAGNALYDAIGIVPNLTRSEVGRRVAVVVISALGNLSGGLIEEGQVFGSSRAAGVPFFNFAVGPGTANVGLTGILRQLSRDTGGQFVAESSPLNYGRVMVNLANIFRGQYLVEHRSGKLDNLPHTLSITYQTGNGPVSGSRTYQCNP
jgi:uncharacterized protein (TIGR03437 family)